MFVAGFSLLTEPPSVEGNLTSEPTPRVQVPSHSFWKRMVFWTQWLKEMFISSNMPGDISLLNVYCGTAMIEVCLWSKKSTIRWVFKPQAAFKWTRSGWPAVFLCCLYFVLWREGQGSNNNSQKKRVNRWIHAKKHKNTSKVSLLYSFYRKISKNNDK